MLTNNLVYYQHAVNSLKNEGVICYPTEAVWGIGCDPRSFSAFKKVLRLKKRSQDKGVILVAATLSQVLPYVDISDILEKDLKRIWPGFVTCLLPRSDFCPDYLTGVHNKVAIRVTSYKPIADLCLEFGSAIVSTSANITGMDPVSDIISAKKLFSKGIDYYLDLSLGGESKPSKIIDFTSHNIKVIRD